ncbi:MAG: hypothetical protein WAM14_07500 [Candidatus Nitrosopolaris sp.]
MNESADSPKLFVINLPEADVARYFCAEIIDRVFRNRKSSFTLTPRIVFVFDEAQEFIPADKRKEDGTDNSSRAVERLLRHGRKYNLNGWISTQRIAHLNTNALQQLHSYFVSTMPMPYDRQLISDLCIGKEVGNIHGICIRKNSDTFRGNAYLDSLDYGILSCIDHRDRIRERVRNIHGICIRINSDTNRSGTDLNSLSSLINRSNSERKGVSKKPNPFPTMSIYNNVAAGLKLNKR